MDGDVIFIDDELDLLQQQQQQVFVQQLHQPEPGPSHVRRYPAMAQRRGRGQKRRSDGVIIGTTSGGAVLRVHPPEPQEEEEEEDAVQFMAAPNVAVPVALSPADDVCFEDVIVDGQDVYFIQEIGEEAEPPQPEEEEQQDVEQFLQAGVVVPVQVPDYQDDDDAEGEEEQDEVIGVEEADAAEADDYYEVDPLELSEVWNDLITANQEILILLELQDLKHHIVDARQIEDQMKQMVCDYCPRVLPDVRAWNQHIKKMHFQTALFECDSCTAKFKHYIRFKDHLNNHSGQRQYQCDECDHQYAYRTGFLVHKILDHMKLNGIYVCPKCDLDCKNAQSYKLHIASHIDYTSSIPHELAAKPKATAAAVVQQQQQVPRAAKPVVPFYSKANEHNKFLNVFESFSKNRVNTVANHVALPPNLQKLRGKGRRK